MSTILTTYQGAILGPIAKLLGYILQGLYAVLDLIGINNTAVCIILFTFLVNALMLPMQIKQQKFSKMTAIMNPEIQAIQKKYKGKTDQASQQKMSLETQAVYQKYGVSPASGCLPMLISLPILFALYRVIYNIPAYVPQIYDIYEGVAKSVMEAGVSVEELSKMIKTNTYVINDAIKGSTAKGLANADKLRYYIDVLGQFNDDGWNTLAAKYSTLKSQIADVATQSKHINSFLGLNIADMPSLKSVSIIIPILSVISQVLSMRIAMAGTQQNMDPNNPTAASMKMMNNVMPFVSGAMCFMFPIGVGIYWVAGNVFRIFQSLGINFYFSKMDMEAEVAKNVEKSKKKFEKYGIDPNTAMQKAANKGNAVKKDNSSISKNANSVKRDIQNNRGNKNYKEGSIAAYANILARSDSEDNK